jgi:ribose/xylose/arabinose/galactoside ABC-type transport system permease subunit
MSAEQASARRPRAGRPRAGRFEGLGLVVILVLIVGGFWIAYPPFVSGVNIINILLTVSVIGILAVPWSMLCISGGLDISIGSMMGFIAVTVTSLFTHGLGLLPSILLGCAIAGFLGFLNGILIERVGINSLITTLGMFSILRGAAFVVTGGQGIVISDASLKFIGLGRIWVFPFSVALLIAFFVAGYLVLRYTQYGRNLFVVGGNEKAARVAGIGVRLARISMYVVTAICSGIGGLIIAAQLSNALPKIGTGYEFAVITAVVLGGVSLSGGKGRMVGVLLGILIIGSLRYGLEITGVHSFFQTIAEGTILLVAVALDQLKLRRGGG